MGTKNDLGFNHAIQLEKDLEDHHTKEQDLVWVRVSIYNTNYQQTD